MTSILRREAVVQIRMQSEVVFCRSVAGAVFVYSPATEHKNDEEGAEFELVRL